MAHDHAHVHTHDHGGNARRLALALAIALGVLAIELAGAWWSGSLALLSDAAHMFTDAAALAISLAATRIAKRPADTARSFGYGRFEVLAAALNALLLILAAAYILWEAWRRLWRPEEIAWDAMLGVAALGLVANLAGMWLLAGGREHNLNVRGAYLEVWSDMLGSVGVIVGAAGIWLTGWAWLDSLIAIGIGLWVLPRSWKLLRASVHVLLEGVPAGLDVHRIERALRELPGIASVHDLHVWAIGSGSISLTVHAVARPPAAPGDTLLQAVRAMLAREFDIHHSTVQLEAVPCEQERDVHGYGPPEELARPHSTPPRNAHAGRGMHHQGSAG